MSANAERVFDYTMVDKVVKQILNICEPKLIFLFGSAARGTAKHGSDIDLLVVMDSDKKPMHRGIDILNSLDVDTTVDLIVMTPAEFETYYKDPNSFTGYILESAKLLYGIL